MSVCEEEATEEAEEEKAAGAELKTKTPHNDVGNSAVWNCLTNLCILEGLSLPARRRRSLPSSHSKYGKNNVPVLDTIMHLP